MDFVDCLCVCVCVYVYISNMDLPLWARKCNECILRGSCIHFTVTAGKGPCVLDGLAGLSLCVCVCVYISNMDMDLQLWARKCSESLLRGAAIISPYLHTRGRSWCMELLACLCVYECLCIYLTWTCRCGNASAAKVSCVVVAIISPLLQSRAVRGTWTCWPVSLCVCVFLTWTCRCVRASAANVSCVTFVINSPRMQRGREW
jgi:hypothetical protein